MAPSSTLPVKEKTLVAGATFCAGDERA